MNSAFRSILCPCASDSTEHDSDYEVDNLDCTDDGEPCEQSHGASYCRQHVRKLGRPVLSH